MKAERRMAAIIGRPGRFPSSIGPFPGHVDLVGAVRPASRSGRRCCSWPAARQIWRRVRRLDRPRPGPGRAAWWAATILSAWTVTSDGVNGWEWSLVAVAFLLDIWFWVAGRRSLKS